MWFTRRSNRNVLPGSPARRNALISAACVCALSVAIPARADDPVEGTTAPRSADDSRYGPFGLFDRRSAYGVGVFPEPFIVDDSDLEVNEFRLDWQHQEGKGQNTNEMTAEVEKGFGLLTLEVEVHYDYDSFASVNPSTGRPDHDLEQGFDNVDLGARYPIYQFVSANGLVDTTFGVAIEVGVPTNSPLSKNTEIVPKIFNDTRIGEHFTLQSIFGYSALLGSGDEGGSNTFEYGLVFGYSIDHDQLPLPGIQQFIPVFELAGETALNHDDAGSDSLTGNIAFRANLDAIGRVQPRLGVGYLFPIDKGARDEFRWGIVTSLVFEF